MSSSAMVKQSCTSAKSRSSSPTPAIPRARCQETRVAANAVGSRRSAGKKSLAWPNPASRTGAVAPPVGAS